MASIVDKLASRSISSRDLGIDIHNHTAELMHFFWRRNCTERCYTQVLECRLLEIEEFTLIKEHIFRAGLSGACECLSTWLPPPEDKHFRPCPFRSSAHILYLHNHPRSKYLCFYQEGLCFDVIRFNNTCKCSELFKCGEKRDVISTIFCLSRKSILTSKVADTYGDWLRSRYFLLPTTRMLRL
jgi:hypothetical protein